MKTITLNNTNLNIPEIGMGCMRINGLETVDAVKEWMDTALEHGINFLIMQTSMEKENARNYLDVYLHLL